MKMTDRVHMVAVVMEGLESYVNAYCDAKEKKGYYPYAGYEVTIERRKKSIKRKIAHIRKELLNISKEL